MFTAALRLPQGTAEQRTVSAARVAGLVELMQLNKCSDTKVGDATRADKRGVSGGERKRLCIACELLNEPSLIFLDEPTSGLDSSMALVVVQALSSLARRADVTVVCSIHQPSSQAILPESSR